MGSLTNNCLVVIIAIYFIKKFNNLFENKKIDIIDSNALWETYLGLSFLK
jgi:hypothetical protein